MPSSLPRSGTPDILALCFSSAMQELPVVRQTQARIASRLQLTHGPEELVRLTNADLLESSLTRIVPVLEAAPQYALLATPELRKQFLELHLEMVLVGWLRERVTSADAHAALAALERRTISTTR